MIHMNVITIETVKHYDKTNMNFNLGLENMLYYDLELACL